MLNTANQYLNNINAHHMDNDELSALNSSYQVSDESTNENCFYQMDNRSSLKFNPVTTGLNSMSYSHYPFGDLAALTQRLMANYWWCPSNFYVPNQGMVTSFSAPNHSPQPIYPSFNINEVRSEVYENHIIYSKADINMQLLKDFQYAIEHKISSKGRSNTVYVCKHEGCNKEFMRTWNLLDHVRMHEGIKPNICPYCYKGFTQRSNLRKHLKIHVNPELEHRKRYTCDDCGAKYTERYNYKVRQLKNNLKDYFIQKLNKLAHKMIWISTVSHGN